MVNKLLLVLQVTESAYSQVLLYGMSSAVGHVSFPELQQGAGKPFSEATGALVDSEVREYLQREMARVRDLLEEKKDLVTKIAERLLEQEVLEREDMVELLGRRPWAEKTSYDDFVAGTGAEEEDGTLPEGLRDWNAPVVKTKEGTEGAEEVVEAGKEPAELVQEAEKEDVASEKENLNENLINNLLASIKEEL